MLRIRFGKEGVTVSYDDGPNNSSVTEKYDNVTVEVQRCSGFWYVIPKILRVIRGGAHLMAALVDLSGGNEKSSQDDK